jgi:hypothetical protein
VKIILNQVIGDISLVITFVVALKQEEPMAIFSPGIWSRRKPVR